MPLALDDVIAGAGGADQQASPDSLDAVIRQASGGQTTKPKSLAEVIAGAPANFGGARGDSMDRALARQEQLGIQASQPSHGGHTGKTIDMPETGPPEKTTWQEIKDIPGALATMGKGAAQLGERVVSPAAGALSAVPLRPEEEGLVKGTVDLAKGAGRAYVASPQATGALADALQKQATGENVSKLSPELEQLRRDYLALGSAAVGAGAGSIASAPLRIAALGASGAAASPDAPVTGAVLGAGIPAALHLATKLPIGGAEKPPVTEAGGTEYTGTERRGTTPADALARTFVGIEKDIKALKAQIGDRAPTAEEAAKLSDLNDRLYANLTTESAPTGGQTARDAEIAAMEARRAALRQEQPQARMGEEPTASAPPEAAPPSTTGAPDANELMRRWKAGENNPAANAAMAARWLPGGRPEPTLPETPTPTKTPTTAPEFAAGLRYWNDVYDSHGGERFGSVHATYGESAPGAPAGGRLDYTIGSDGNIRINMVEVAPDVRRQGIATKLLAKLKEEYPGAKIDPGMATQEGSAWLKTVEMNKPEPPERIVSAATMHVPTGDVETGPIHIAAMEKMRASGKYPDVFQQGEDNLAQGFTTDRGRFVDRNEAESIARNAKQVQGSTVRQRSMGPDATGLAGEDLVGLERQRPPVNPRTQNAPPGTEGAQAQTARQAQATRVPLSFAEQKARFNAALDEMGISRLNLDPKALVTQYSGPEIEAWKEKLNTNWAETEAISKQLANESLPADQAGALHETLTNLQNESSELMRGIVRESGESGRNLGYLRQLAAHSLDPDVWAVNAQRLAGDVRIPDEVIADIRRLARIAQEACGGI